MSIERSIIPKKIHYCWFGKKELPQSAVKCIDSWEKYLPDYEIIQWNEDNFDVQCCDYVKEAYEEKQWAFVSDYARMLVLYQDGGLYFDTDVEMIRPIDDIIAAGPFMALEDDAKASVNPGLGFGSDAGNPVLGEILQKYQNRHFVKKDGSIDHTTIVTFVTDILKKYGLKTEIATQKICGINIYPQRYFCPLNYYTGELQVTEDTRTIHSYDGTWHSEIEEEAHQIKRKLSKILPEHMSGPIAAFWATSHKEGILGAMKKTIKR